MKFRLRMTFLFLAIAFLGAFFARKAHRESNTYRISTVLEFRSVYLQQNFDANAIRALAEVIPGRLQGVSIVKLDPVAVNTPFLRLTLQVPSADSATQSLTDFLTELNRSLLPAWKRQNQSKLKVRRLLDALINSNGDRPLEEVLAKLVQDSKKDERVESIASAIKIIEGESHAVFNDDEMNGIFLKASHSDVITVSAWPKKLSHLITFLLMTCTLVLIGVGPELTRWVRQNVRFSADA